MKMRKWLFLMVFGWLALAASAQIGSWKAYMAYSNVAQIEKAGSIIYVLASDNLYAYNTNDESIQTYDKVNFLSDCHIIHIAWCPKAERLVVVYQNNNIDFIDRNDNVVNLPDYHLKSMTVDKTVNSVYVNDIHAYLATAFGIVKLNVKTAEISNTYQLGFSVNHCYIEGNAIYAASKTHGTYKGLLADNLLDKANWTRVGGYTEPGKTVDPQLQELVATLNPGGPKYNYFHSLKLSGDLLYTTGGYTSGGLNAGRPGCVQVLGKNDEWTIFQDDMERLTGTPYLNLNGIDIDPLDPRHTIAYGRTGVYEFYDGEFQKHWSCDNSPLQYAVAVANREDLQKQYVEVLGARYDQQGNFWCLNSLAASQSILCLTKEGEWKSYHHPELMAVENGKNRSFGSMERPIFDHNGLMWFVNNYWIRPAFCSYNTQTDNLQVYTNFINQDETKLDFYYIRCITEDKDGNLWLGTSVGPVYLANADRDEDPSTVRFQQVKVPRNDGSYLADYLLANVDIQCIAIDGGNRKWFGTSDNGVYLISSDNLQQVAHFTTTNSNLLSNNIESITIDEQTGEVFISTNQGLCSYISDATTPADEMQKDQVWAYPNPVHPGYNGLITVTGLSFNASVKITTANGTLVNEGRSNGGTYTWNGRDQQNQPVASGVYMVQTATEEGSKGVVCKIAIIR